MEKAENQLKSSKEYKRHRSAFLPPGQINNLPFKDYSDNLSNTTNSTKCDGLFNLKSNSLFAYQEFDQFSFLCDNETNNDKLNDIEQKIESNFNEDNKDDLNNTSTSYSLKEYNEDHQTNHNAKKRKSAFDSMPPYFSQYLNCLNYQNGDEMPNFEKTNNNMFENMVNNQFSSDSKINHNENQIKKGINPLLAHFKNNQEHISNLENRRRSQGFAPIYNYNIYCPNYNVINNFQNIFFLNNAFNGNGGLQKNYITGENNNFTNENVNIENKDFPPIINEFPENFRKKSNSLVSKTNPLYNQFNQNKSNNHSYPSNNFNLLSLISKNNSKNKKYLNNNNLNILYIFQEQSNCRNIQEQLELHKNDKKYFQNFLEQIKPELINIIEHQFGNYVIQKFLEILINQENKQLFLEFTSIINKNNKLYEICINNYGTRVIQKTLEKLMDKNYSKIETPELNDIINKLIENHLYDLCHDKNGNHVYLKLLKVFSYESEDKNNFFYEYLSDNSLDVALLQQGATIFSTTLGLGNSKQKEKICLKIFENIEKLINDKYGNYTVQAIINKLKDEKILIEPIYLYISNNIVNLSKQKCSSNVIDTFIMKKDEYSKMLVNDMIKNNIIKDIIKDQYGNYVVQKAMSISDEETVNKIIKQIKPIIPEMLETNIGKKIYEKLREHYINSFDEE